MFNQKVCYPILWSILFLTSCGENDNSKPNVAEAVSESSTPAMDQAATERQVIKTAEIKLHVDQVPAKLKQVQRFVQTCDGHITHYEMNSNRVCQKEVECSLDSSYVIQEIDPEAYMKIKVPVLMADSFTNCLLSMDAQIDRLLVDEEDVTEEMNEKKSLIQVGSLGNNQAVELKEKMYADDKLISQIKEKTSLAKLNYKTRYLWFDVYLHGNTIVEKSKIASIKTLHEPFYVNGIKAIQSGWYGASILIVTLLNVWPLLILIGLVFILYKKRIVIRRV